MSPASVTIATLAVVLLELLNGLVDLLVSGTGGFNSVQTVDLPQMDGPALQIALLIQPLTNPWLSLFQPLGLILLPALDSLLRLNALIRFVLGLGLWSVVGLILCRRSALLFARNDESTFGQAIRYSRRRWAASSGAPLIPLAAAALIGLMAATIGLVGRLPLLGGPWLFIISPVLAVMGFAIAFLLVATALGWPFMVAAVSTDDCDSFGGLSRSYSGLTGRPWQVAFHVVLGAIVGLILLQIVTLFGEFTVWCVMACTAAGSGQEQANQSLLGPLTIMIHEIVKGVGVSYFWSAAVVIYLLLRHDVDGVPVDRLAPDDDSRPIRDPFPVVGIPAMDAANASNGKVENEN